MAKILIIDDEIDLRTSVAEFLILVGHEIVEANDGLEGLEKVRNDNPDLILCDIMMPQLDGYGFLKHHHLSSYSHIPVLLMTAKIELKDELFAKSLGAKGYIRKPFKFEQLSQIIRDNL